MKYWFILFLGLNSLKAQNPIQIENHWLYTNYYEAGQPLSTAQLWQRLESQSASAVASQHARRKLRTVYWLQGTATLVLGGTNRTMGQQRQTAPMGMEPPRFRGFGL